MSTIGYENWAVDLGDVTAIYPFQGTEVAMVVIGIVFWLVWHRIQYVRESEHLKQARKLAAKDKLTASVERY